jgi:hypothetical protein
MDREVALVLSTRLKEPKLIQIDGEDFSLLGVDHLSPTEESEVMALFARYGYKAAELDAQPNVSKGKVLADAMKETRIVLITKLTDIPKAVALRLPLSQQVVLLETIQAQVQAVEDGDEAPDEDETEDGTS